MLCIRIENNINPGFNMLELFRNAPKLSVGVLRPPEWPFIQRGFQRNIDKVVDYHKLYTKGVKSNHILIRLLQSIAVPKTMELERYYASVDAIGLRVSMAMKMTSSIYRGYFHTGVFYGSNTPEILIATDEYFDFEYVNKNWRDVSAVTPLLHNKSDMGIHLPNGEDYSAEDGLAVIMINVPMLAVQYRAFWNEQRDKPEGVFSKNIMQFIGGYVLPNMLQKQMDICLFNRICNKFNGINDGKNISFRNHPFILSDYDRHIDAAIDKVLININRSIKRFDIVLRQIPSFYHTDIYESLMLPDLAPTMMISWAMVLTRLKAVNFLFDICREDLKNRNMPVITQILRAFRVSNTYQMFKVMLPDSIYYEAESYIDNILDSINRNDF